jgi:hypothetical protein
MYVEVPQYDYGHYLYWTITEKDGVTVKPLNGYTVKFRYWREGNPSTLLLDGTCEVTDADNGACRYMIQENDFDEKGDFVGEHQMTQVGVRESSLQFPVIVTESPT